MDETDNFKAPISASGTATEDAMGVLHGTVAIALTQAVSGEACTAAMLGAAITFLKNNNITASASKNAELDELNRSLAARRRKKAITPRQMEEASEQFSSLMGMSGLPQ